MKFNKVSKPPKAKTDWRQRIFFTAAILMILIALVWLGLAKREENNTASTTAEQTTAADEQPTAAAPATPLVYTSNDPEVIGIETLASLVERESDETVQGTARYFFFAKWNSTTRSKTTQSLDSYNVRYGPTVNTSVGEALGLSRKELTSKYTWQVDANREDGSCGGKDGGIDGGQYGFTIYWIDYAISGSDIGTDVPAIRYSTTTKVYDKGTVRVHQVDNIDVSITADSFQPAQ
jgi:hypothetical protein